MDQKEANSPKRSRCQDIIKLRAEINKIETKKKYKESMKQRVRSSRKQQNRHTFIQVNKRQRENIQTNKIRNERGM